jgi:hypothetical protein
VCVLVCIFMRSWDLLEMYEDVLLKRSYVLANNNEGLEKALKVYIFI